MKYIFSFLLLVLGLLSAVLRAQVVPPTPPAPPANLSGVTLRTWYIDSRITFDLAGHQPLVVSVLHSHLCRQ